MTDNDKPAEARCEHGETKRHGYWDTRKVGVFVNPDAWLQCPGPAAESTDTPSEIPASAQPAADFRSWYLRTYGEEPEYSRGVSAGMERAWNAARASRQPECIDCAAEVPHDRWGRRRDYPTPHPYTKELQAEFEAGQQFEREYPSRQPDTAKCVACGKTLPPMGCKECTEYAYDAVGYPQPDTVSKDAPKLFCPRCGAPDPEGYTREELER